MNSKRGGVIPVLEETAQVKKRKVPTGRVRVRTVTRITSETVRAQLREEHAEVVRVPVNRQVSTAPGVRTVNGTTIVPVLEEVLVVEKRLMLKEELHIRRKSSAERLDVPVKLRKQEAKVERSKAGRNETPGHNRRSQ